MDLGINEEWEQNARGWGGVTCTAFSGNSMRELGLLYILKYSSLTKLLICTDNVLSSQLRRRQTDVLNMVSSKKKKLYAAVNDSYGRTKSFIKHLNQCSAHKHKRRQYLQSHFNLFAHRENAESLLNSPYVARDSLLCSNHKSELQLLDVRWLAELKYMQQERPAAPASDHVALENVV